MEKVNKLIWRVIGKFSKSYLLKHPKLNSTYLYNISFGRTPNWKKPRDLNEWIIKLSLSDLSADWDKYADKYLVRNFVKSCGFGHILTNVYGAWEKTKDIDFSSLPKQFVLKTNHGSGDVKIVTNKEEYLAMGGGKSLAYFDVLLNKSYGIDQGEYHYQRIKPLIMAEELLDVQKQSFPSTSLIDYKMWCINGHFEVCMVMHDRDSKSVMAQLFDRDWNVVDGIVEVGHLRKSNVNVPKPINWAEMITIAERLSSQFPEARIDLYEVNGKVYFGEITLTSAAGRMRYLSPQVLKYLGDKIRL